jgi:hypothetical protein
MRYIINYGTGIIKEVEANDLEEVKKIADEGSAYTQESYSIEDVKRNVLAYRLWWGVAYDEDECQEDDPICFGSFGYYSDWQTE